MSGVSWLCMRTVVDVFLVEEASAMQEERLYIILLGTYLFGALFPSQAPLIRGKYEINTKHEINAK